MTLTRRILALFFNLYLYIFGSRIGALKLKHLADLCSNDIEKLVDLAFNFNYSFVFLKSWKVSLKPQQVKTEITALCRIVREFSPRSIVEIGAGRGGTLFLFARVTNPDKIISVDLPRSSFERGYPFGMIPFVKSLSDKHVIQLIRADSHSEETLAKIKSRLKGSCIDLLFIDVDHTYQGVKRDFLMYSPLVRRGGIVAFHDIIKQDPTTDCEVDRFWNEIKRNHNHIEIVGEKNQKGFGIGVLYI